MMRRLTLLPILALSLVACDQDAHESCEGTEVLVDVRQAALDAELGADAKLTPVDHKVADFWRHYVTDNDVLQGLYRDIDCRLAEDGFTSVYAVGDDRFIAFESMAVCGEDNAATDTLVVFDIPPAHRVSPRDPREQELANLAIVLDAERRESRVLRVDRGSLVSRTYAWGELETLGQLGTVSVSR